MEREAEGKTWQRPDADSDWRIRRPLNAERPPHVPLKPQGSIPVIVRLLWPTHEELMPAEAVRWTKGHVQVAVIEVGAAQGATELYVWLRASDVYRTIPRRPRLGRAGQ
ncbi:hypothetical protein [Krasilnikoviella flava]|uniref:Uncharacterized protein n=1 Tax=Krasilnikoviella flava TaxID=526729 RepID=A0A1T5LNT4_9MICO|nr:hypothetical protein [Krasilnikoviella flava]SKC77667.1 hypothetical protein SAMN04324258_3645 [Krasilnikoviella flava]